jgi:uncharacterized membrane protein YdbT with pleckstrin-like domain
MSGFNGFDDPRLEEGLREAQRETKQFFEELRREALEAKRREQELKEKKQRELMAHYAMIQRQREEWEQSPEYKEKQEREERERLRKLGQLPHQRIGSVIAGLLFVSGFIGAVIIAGIIAADLFTLAQLVGIIVAAWAFPIILGLILNMAIMAMR